MTVGDLMLFMTYLGMLYDPLCKISGSGGSFQAGIASAQRVFEVLDADAAIKDAPGAIGLPQQARRLTLDRVEFRYAGGPNVLDGISVEVKPGEMVAFVGSSGAGKSTLLNLLPRFYDPTNGAIRLDGIDVRRVKLQDLRKHIAIVHQDNILLPTTVAENIAYGRPEATALEIQQAAELAGAHDFICAMPNGYDTVVTEGGQNVSGGQRQRIAIARALLTHAPIIILDEPTSALDPHHEQLLSEQLQTLKRHRTIIIVSHRVHTLTACDQILLLDGGQIVERGTHDELVDLQGRYAGMAGALFSADQPGELVAA
jgi:ABC-type multidrug transport system fused ATPase/permease subunit